ncbi:hypothetical protein PSHT_04661 [Puccinia striiformis]|uniref:Uncharacterized protein n=1 Tax=Puccinia striiformis TaxID=27350 RepID=A0A2S4WCJ4_9BASI|nr:hypothetical protein PSHT_04661 [Puccinia striiformis]
MSVCASGVLTSQVPRLRSTGYSYIPSISPPPLPHTGINIEPSLRSQLQLRGCINSSRGLAGPSTSSTDFSSVYACLEWLAFNQHSQPQFHQETSSTKYDCSFTPAQRAEVHAALNELNRVYTEHQAAAAPATDTNHEQQPNPPVNESPDNSVESETDQLASSESGSNATPVPPTPVLQPADIPVLTQSRYHRA